MGDESSGARDDDPGNGDRWEAAQEGAELLREGRVEEAIRELEALVTSAPDNEYALYFLGAARFEAGHFERAMKAYLGAVDRSPGYVGALAGLGHSLRMLGRHDQALRVAKQILLKAKDDPDGHHIAGLAHFARGEAAAAREHLERFLATRPELEVAREIHGILEVLRGRFAPLDPDDEG